MEIAQPVYPDQFSMENLPAWPESVFEDATTMEMTKAGLAITQTKNFAATVKNWRDKVVDILYDTDNAT